MLGILSLVYLARYLVEAKKLPRMLHYYPLGRVKRRSLLIFPLTYREARVLPWWYAKQLRLERFDRAAGYPESVMNNITSFGVGAPIPSHGSM